MGSQYDLVISFIVAGMLVLLVLSMQIFMVETTAETSAIHTTQARINVGMQRLHEEVRGFDRLIQLNDSVLVFGTAAGDSVRIGRTGSRLVLHRTPAIGAARTDTLELGLTDTDFRITDTAGAAPYFLRIRLDAQGTAIQRDIYLRNLD